MSSYEVLQPVVIDGTHYTRREIGRVIEVDDKQAKELVESGHLAPVLMIGDGKAEEAALAPAIAEAQEKPRRRRGTAES